MPLVPSFVIRSPREVLFGWNAIRELPGAAKKLGSRPLVVIGGGSIRRGGLLDGVLEGLRDHGLKPFLFEGVGHDPSVEIIDLGREAFARDACDLVIGLGGGSVMDAAKAIAGLANEDAPTAEFVGGREISPDCVPNICCTTTSGTGSEVTHVSVLTDPERRLKASIRTEGMMPSVAIVDPALTLSVPPEQTAFTGLDALTQALESYLSRGDNPFSDHLALEAAVRISAWLPVAYTEGDNREARENMSLGSMFAGLALASARLGLVHGIAHPLGALYGLAHGEACALLLPYVLEFNAPVRAPKMAMAARAMGISAELNDDDATVELIEWTERLCEEMGCRRRFAEFGLKHEDYPAIIEATMASGSSKANPRIVREEDVVALLDKAM